MTESSADPLRQLEELKKRREELVRKREAELRGKYEPNEISEGEHFVRVMNDPGAWSSFDGVGT